MKPQWLLLALLRITADASLCDSAGMCHGMGHGASRVDCSSKGTDKRGCGNLGRGSRAPPERRHLSRGTRTGRVPSLVKLLLNPPQKGIAGKHSPITPNPAPLTCGLGTFPVGVCRQSVYPWGPLLHLVLL